MYLPLSASDKAIRNAACDEAQGWSRERECSFSEIVSSYAVLRYKAKPVYTEDEADRLHDEHCYAVNHSRLKVASLQFGLAWVVAAVSLPNLSA